MKLPTNTTSPLISVSSLARLLVDPTTTTASTLKILDARGQWKEPAGPLYDDYKSSHIPNAIFCDWTKDFLEQGRSRLGLANVSDKAHTKASIDRLGIQRDDHVVVYDAYNHMISARIWWALKVWGFENVQVLDGGWDAWVGGEGNLPTSTEIPTIVPGSNFEPTWQASLETPLEEVIRTKDENDVLLMDCRKEAGYKGNRDDIKSGHIPGAVNVPWTEFLTDSGTFKPAEQVLETLQNRVPDHQNNKMISSCGSGYCGAIVLLALNVAGIDVSLFDGSIAAWKERGDRPLEQS